jgi:hypothetical protein
LGRAAGLADDFQHAELQLSFVRLARHRFFVLGEGWLDGEMRYVENDNGNVTEGTLTFTEFFVLENGRWLLYGNQNPSIKDSEKKRRTWRELLRRQPHKTKPQP